MIETMTSTRLIGTVHAAMILGVTRSTLVRMVKAGKITPDVTAPGYNGPLLFDPKKVRAFSQSSDHDDAA